MRYFSVYFFAILINNLNAQELLPPILSFEGLQENWVYISKDENFNAYYKSLSNTGFTPYALKSCKDIFQKDNNIYILETSQSPSPFLGDDGFLLHKINKESGIKSWVYHNNFMAGNKYRELYWKSKIKLDKDGYISIFGYRDLDTLNYVFPKFSFYSNPIGRTIDTFGNLVKLKYGSNQSRQTENIAQRKNILMSMSGNRYNHCFFDLADANDYIEDFKCYSLSKSFEIVKDSFFKISFPSELSNNVGFSLKYQKSYLQLSSDTILALTLFGTTNKENSPENAKLSWIVIDSLGMNLVRNIDISKDIFKPQDLSDFHQQIEIQIVDNYIVLSQVVSITQPIVDAKFISWILIYDLKGNLISKPELIYNKNKKYSLVKVLKIINDKMFLGVQMDDGQVMGSDILEISLQSGINKKVGSIVTPKMSNYQVGSIEQFQFIDDDNLVVALPMEIYHNNERSTIRYYFSFKMSDIGLISSTKNSEIIGTFSITPNPSSHLITVTIPEINNAVTLRITDQMGRSVWVQDIYYTETVIDISSLTSGMYFVSLQDASSGRQLGKVQKLVKVE